MEFGFPQTKVCNKPPSIDRKNIHSRTEWAYRLPMRRERLTVSSRSGYAAERAQLAASASVPEEDIDLLGVYTNVPVSAVSKVALADEGAVLNVWLKSNVHAERQVRSVTIIIGRRRSNGKLIQSVVPKAAAEPPPDGRLQ